METCVTMSINDYELLKGKEPNNYFKMVELSELRAMRAKLALSMDKVAAETGVNKATISRIELERNCSYQNVFKLYNYYRSELDSLIFFK